jgi:hypothetical protein
MSWKGEETNLQLYVGVGGAGAGAGTGADAGPAGSRQDNLRTGRDPSGSLPSSPVPPTTGGFSERGYAMSVGSKRQKLIEHSRTPQEKTDDEEYLNAEAAKHSRGMKGLTEHISRLRQADEGYKTMRRANVLRDDLAKNGELTGRPRGRHAELTSGNHARAQTHIQRLGDSSKPKSSTQKTRQKREEKNKSAAAPQPLPVQKKQPPRPGLKSAAKQASPPSISSSPGLPIRTSTPGSFAASPPAPAAESDQHKSSSVSPAPMPTGQKKAPSPPGRVSRESSSPAGVYDTPERFAELRMPKTVKK